VRLYLYPFAILIGCGPLLSGQSFDLPKDFSQQRNGSDKGPDEYVSLTFNWRGDIAAAGNAARGDQGGQDIGLALYDAQLNRITERHIGRQGDDGIGQIATLPDGRYILAGYSSKPSGRTKTRATYFGKRDGWVLVLDERGETQHEILLGTSENDAFTSMAVCPDGSIWLSGNSENKAWLVRLNADFRVVWERKVQYHQLATNTTAAALLPDGTYYVVGGVEEMDRKHLWVAGFDTSGRILMDKIYPASQAEYGTAIAVADTHLLAITGIVNDPLDRENGFVSLLDRSGVMQHYQPMGGREYDRINALIRLRSGQLLSGGGSASFERGSRRLSAWIGLLQPNGSRSGENYYGNKLDDEVMALVEHPDGRIFAAGTRNRQALKLRRAWIFQLSDRTETNSGTGLSVVVDAAPLRVASGSGQALTPRFVLPFLLENKGKKGQNNLRAVVRADDPATADLLRVPGSRSVLLPPVAAGGRLKWSLPLQPGDKSPPGRYRFSVQFFQGNTALAAPQAFDLQIGPPNTPQLALAVIRQDSVYLAGQENFITAEIRNTGPLPAGNIVLNVSGPPGVDFPPRIQVGDLPPGGRTTCKIPIVPRSSAVGPGAVRLHLRATDGSLSCEAVAETALNVSGPGVVSSNSGAGVVAIWLYPNPDNFDRATIVWSQEEITIQVKIVSGQPVTRQQFCLQINGEPCPTGAKFDEVQIKGDNKSKTFSQKVRLREGTNVLQAVVQGASGTTSSEPLTILYSPSKPNLHIVSIGVSAADLKYTVKDARDFALALSGASNKAFGKVFVDTLLDEGLTTKTEILKTLKRLQYRYADLQILPGDLLVIFISGHGLGAYDGSFRLAASDYDAPFMQETSLDFEQDLLNYLQSLPCRKIFFVDACHSGTASGTGLAGIATRRNGLNMLVSCQPDEYSYEDDNWKNGAFTRALVNGLQTFMQQTETLDQNADKALDISELFAYIQKEVPALVDKKRPKTKTSQHPNLIVAEREKPVILLEKSR
jgi:hypothetical protein